MKTVKSALALVMFVQFFRGVILGFSWRLEVPKMKKIFTLFALLAIIINAGVANAADVEIAYWKGDRNCPIWVERDDHSMIVFKISSARELDAAFSKDRKLIMFDAYDIESDGRITEHPIGPNGGYGLFYNSSTYMILYPESRRFPEGQQIEIENPYQLKICKMLINESHQHSKYAMPRP